MAQLTTRLAWSAVTDGQLSYCEMRKAHALDNENVCVCVMDFGGPNPDGDSLGVENLPVVCSFSCSFVF